MDGNKYQLNATVSEYKLKNKVSIKINFLFFIILNNHIYLNNIMDITKYYILI